MSKLAIFLVFLALTGTFAAGAINDTTDNEVRPIKLPTIFQSPLYKKILARRNIVPETREDSLEKPVLKSTFDLSYPNLSTSAFDPSKSHYNNGLANITSSIIKSWMHFNHRLSKTASTLPELFAAKGAMIGSALATPIRMYTHTVNQLARSISPQSSSTIRQTSIFDLPIDPRVSHVEADHNAVMRTIQNNAMLIGKQIAQMGHEIRQTGKNISSVGINLLEFSKKATEALSKAPRFPPVPDDTVPIGLEPSVNVLYKLNNSTPKEVTATVIPKTLETSSMVTDVLVALNKSENLQPVSQTNTEIPLSQTPATSVLKISETISPVFQTPVVVSELPVTPALNIVNEEDTSVAVITEPSVSAAVVVTTMEMLAPVSLSSPALAESALNAVEPQSNETVLNILGAQTTEAAYTEQQNQQANTTEPSLLPEMKSLNRTKVELETAELTNALN